MGHMGHGVEGERSSGGFGSSSNWVTESAPWRWQVPRQSAPVSPPADDYHTLAAGRDGLLLRQELHGEMDAIELPARNRQVARLLGAAGQQQGVEILDEVFHGNACAHMGVGPELDPFGAELLQAAVDEMLFEFENWECRSAAGRRWRRFFSKTVTSWPARASCCAAARPAGPEPTMATRLPVRICSRLGFDKAFLKGAVDNALLDLPDGDGRLADASTHAALAGSGTERPVKLGKIVVACNWRIASRQRPR